ncbi:outer membrane beta-barrel protein [Marinomonas sp. 2405UD66-6]|uniref:outer membrane beta-barrel protein n=1 Tax=Marinomonas sp. 2405UD66-6 TaxID=3391834 RepID=UPI0039C9B752
MKKLILASSLLLPTFPVHAIESLPWTQASLAYTRVTPSISDSAYTKATPSASYNLHGVSFIGTNLLDENAFVTGRLESTSKTGGATAAEFMRLSLGVGYRQSILDTINIFGKASYESNYFKESSSESISNYGYGLEGGARFLIAQRLELGASLSRITFAGVSEAALNLSAAFHISNHHSIGLFNSRYEDASYTDLRWTYSF